MIKKDLEQFITKYHLEGMINSAIIRVQSEVAEVNFKAEDSTVMGCIQYGPIPFPDGVYPIYDTNVARRLLGVLGDEIFVTTATSKVLELTSEGTKATIALADPDNIREGAGLKKEPVYQIQLNLSDTLLTSYLRGATALSDTKHMAVVSDGKTVKLVIGYQDKFNANQITLNVPDEDIGDSNKIMPIRFPAGTLRSIMSVNRTMPIRRMNVSDAGLMNIEFSGDNYTCSYYLTKLATTS